MAQGVSVMQTLAPTWPGAALPPPPLTLDVVTFENALDTLPKPKRTTWDALVRSLSSHRERTEKDGSAWAPAAYRVGTTRGKENVTHVGALVFDVDHGEPAWQLLEGYEHIVHTTFSNSDANPSYRVVIPLARPVDAAEWESFWHRSRAALCPTVDDACKDASRLFYTPSCPPGAPRRVVHGAGRFLDPDEVPPLPEVDAAAEPAHIIRGDGSRPGDDFNRRGDVRALIERLGWKLRYARGAESYWLRPGKRGGTHSATLNYQDTGLFYCFTSSAPPLEPGKAYTPFALFALLDHNGDWRAATRALAAQGYGAPLAPSPTISAKSAAKADTQNVGSLRQSWQPSGVLVCLSDVVAESVTWAWDKRFPFGKLSIIDGDPGNGKSSLTMDVVARLSTGSPMPDGSASDTDGPVTSIIMTMEDGLGDTVRPRLEAAGADLSRVIALTYVLEEPKGDAEQPTKRLPSIPRDVEVLRAAIKKHGARFVVIDPLMAYLTSDSHKDQEVRQGLAPLADLAEELGVAIVIVRHFNKAAGGSAIYRGGGSIGIIGAARSAMLVAKDPDDPDGARRVLASAKCNLSEPPQSLAYHLEGAANGAVRVVWEGDSAHTASQLLAIPPDEEERSALSEAEDVLRTILVNGAMPAKEVQSQARNAGIAERTLWRAKRSLGVVAAKVGFSQGWCWSLPAVDDGPKAAKKDEGCQRFECQPSRQTSGTAAEEEVDEWTA